MVCVTISKSFKWQSLERELIVNHIYAFMQTVCDSLQVASFEIELSKNNVSSC